MKKFATLFALLFLLSTSFAQNFGLLFDGDDTSLEIDHKPIFNVTDTYTIEAWIYANSWKDQAWMGSIVNKDGQGPDRGFGFRAGDDGRLSFVMAVDNEWNEVATTALMNTEQWHHVAIVINSGLMTLYIDGEPSASNTYSGSLSGNTFPLTIGASPGFGGRHFDGIIDEIRIWDIARSQSQIADNIDTEFTGSESNLVAYFPMNEGTGLTTTNLVDAACSASMANMNENNWVDGYSIPDFDLSVLPLGGIDVVNMKIRPVKIQVDIKNLGTQDLDNVELTVAVDGDEQFTETVPQTLISGEQITYEFTIPVDFTGLTNPELTITGYHPDDQNSLNNSKSVTLNTQAGNIIRLFDGEAHNFGAGGQNHYNTVLLPASLAEYETLLLHINLNCPGGGCDPWDQPAKVNAITENGTFEIARYITPYGISCGPWTVDVTDFKEALAGLVTFHSYIQVWGPSGWLVTLDLELVEGNDPNPYKKITALWESDYWVYGDPDINDELDPVNVSVASNTEESHVRMTITGHGQGNTNNAAEFFQATHQFQLDGNLLDNHLLWKDDCADNECDNQQGTWLFPRAGWCPGQEVTPYIVNTTSDIDAGTDVELGYVFQDYTNLLDTGYNGSSHTEPHFRIWSYFVESSSSPYEDYFNLLALDIDPEVSGMGSNEVLDDISISVMNTGNQDMSDFEVSYFINNQLITTETINATLAPGESMDHSFATQDGFNPGAENIFYGVVSHPDDQNIGDDVAKAQIGTSSIHPVENALAGIDVYPNPVQNATFQVRYDPLLEGSIVEIMNADGRRVKTTQLSGGTIQFRISTSGIYFIRVIHPDGFVATRKVVVAN